MTAQENSRLRQWLARREERNRQPLRPPWVGSNTDQGVLVVKTNGEVQRLPEWEADELIFVGKARPAYIRRVLPADESHFAEEYYQPEGDMVRLDRPVLYFER